jgi:hypothetical protein
MRALLAAVLCAAAFCAAALAGCGNGDNFALCDGCGTPTRTPTPTATEPTPTPTATPDDGLANASTFASRRAS